MHPIFVHFPIGLLTIYSLIELVDYFYIRKRSGFRNVPRTVVSERIFFIKSAFLLIGTAASYVTLLTGLLAEKSLETDTVTRLIDLHKMWGIASALCFTLISIGYAIDLVGRYDPNRPMPDTFKRWSSMIVRQGAGPLLAFIGLIAITVTGSLGGSIVYGFDADPVIRFLRVFFL